jgi:hypothetical protein
MHYFIEILWYLTFPLVIFVSFQVIKWVLKKLDKPQA